MDEIEAYEENEYQDQNDHSFLNHEDQNILSQQQNKLSWKKIQELKTLIDQQLQNEGVYNKVRSLIQQNVQQSTNGIDGEGCNQEKNIYDTIKESNVVSQILGAINKKTEELGDAQEEKISYIQSNLKEGPHLQLKLLGGRAFLDNLLETSPSEITSYTIGEQSPLVFLSLHLAFRNQRFRSQEVKCEVEPLLNETFILDLQEASSCSKKDLKMLSVLNEPIFITLTRVMKHQREDNSPIKVDFIASHRLEWRRALCRGGVAIPVELRTSGQEGKIKIPIGILDFRLDLIPPPIPSQALNASFVTDALNQENRKDAEAQRSFYQYARKWWEEYTEIDVCHKNRLVKIFAEDETGEYRSVCSFLLPLQADRILDSPRHAARFVSLLPFERQSAIGGGKKEIWHTLHTFFSLRKGDCEDHSILLASLFLGFGLDAFVCVGTIKDEETSQSLSHVWVLTRSGVYGRRTVTFWESLKGKRYAHSLDSTDAHPYSTIDCVFNHEKFYANIHKDNSVLQCCFDFEHSGYWKAMEKNYIVELPHQKPIALIPPQMDVRFDEIDLEKALKQGIVAYRKDHGLSTKWDNNLSYYLSTALNAYELEKITGLSCGNEEFQASIKGNVPEGFTFKGFPALFTHHIPWKILTELEHDTVSKDILLTKAGNCIEFAIRVKMFPYPEGLQATWIMLAVKYRPIAP